MRKFTRIDVADKKRILELLAEGLSKSVIAERMGRSTETIYSTLSRMKKGKKEATQR